MDESWQPVLEKQNIRWKRTDISLEMLYEKICYLWKEQDNLNIVDVDLLMAANNLRIIGLDDREIFYNALEDCQRDYYIVAEEEGYISEQATLEEYMENQRTNFNVAGNLDETAWHELCQCIKTLKKQYPQYSYDNLFSLAFFNRDAESYMNFDQELNEAAEKNVYIKNDKNPFDERKYGDEERLALKVLIKNYKQLNPEKTYQELYDIYIKDIEETDSLSQSEKRSKYMWKFCQTREAIAKMSENSQGTDIPPAAAAGCVVLAGGIIGMLLFKR